MSNKNNGWISFYEQKPSEEEEVWMYHPKGGVFQGSFKSYHTFASDKYGYLEGVIQWWQPWTAQTQPEPPEGVEEVKE